MFAAAKAQLTAELEAEIAKFNTAKAVEPIATASAASGLVLDPEAIRALKAMGSTVVFVTHKPSLLADADLQQAAAGAASAIFFNQGQVCCAGSRLLVQQAQLRVTKQSVHMLLRQQER